MAKYNYSQLRNLWIRNGGPVSEANTAAAVAMAESGGDSEAYNQSGATGLWQILGAVIPGDLKNPNVNARNAVKKFKDAGGSAKDDQGRTKGWQGPWVAYQNGSYKQFKQEGGGGIPVVGDILDAATAPFDAAKAAGGAIVDVVKYFFGDNAGSHWVRIGKIVGGIVLTMLGFGALLKSNDLVNSLGAVGKISEVMV